MKKITDVISLSELSRLINISRPTLYKYIDSYENGRREEVPANHLSLFDFIVSSDCLNKSQIYDFSMTSFESKGEKALIDRIKYLLDDDSYKELFTLIVNNTDKLDIEEIIFLINRRIK